MGIVVMFIGVILYPIAQSFWIGHTVPWYSFLYFALPFIVGLMIFVHGMISSNHGGAR
jgi:hypothetical protein